MVQKVSGITLLEFRKLFDPEIYQFNQELLREKTCVSPEDLQNITSVPGCPRSS